MELQFNEYVISHSPNSNKYDLGVLRTVKGGKGEGKVKNRHIGYDMTMQRCVETIIQELLKKNESTVEIDEFFAVYKATADKVTKGITKAIKNVEKRTT